MEQKSSSSVLASIPVNQAQMEVMRVFSRMVGQLYGLGEMIFNDDNRAYKTFKGNINRIVYDEARKELLRVFLTCRDISAKK